MVKPSATSGIWNTSGRSLFISFCQVSRPSPGHHGGSGSCREKNTRNRTRKNVRQRSFWNMSFHAIFNHFHYLFRGEDSDHNFFPQNICLSSMISTLSIRAEAWQIWHCLWTHHFFTWWQKRRKGLQFDPRQAQGKYETSWDYPNAPSGCVVTCTGGVPPTLEENLVHQRCALDKIIRGSKSKKTICKNDSGASALGKFHYFPKW